MLVDDSYIEKKSQEIVDSNRADDKIRGEVFECTENAVFNLIDLVTSFEYYAENEHTAMHRSVHDSIYDLLSITT